MEKDEKILKIKQVVEVVCISRSSLYTMVKRGDFPKPLKLGMRSSGWLKTEVDAWISERASLRDGGAA